MGMRQFSRGYLIELPKEYPTRSVPSQSFLSMSRIPASREDLVERDADHDDGGPTSHFHRPRAQGCHEEWLDNLGHADARSPLFLEIH